jgi:hypothetical protein
VKSGHLWLIYAWCFSIVIVLSAGGRMALRFKKPEVVSRFDVVEGFLGLIAIPALFGFARQRAVGLHAFWMVIALVFIVLSVWQFASTKMRELYSKGWFPVTASIGAMIALGGPALYALVTYAFFEPQLWR